jgi:quercetin dioxygenase-like cupin family protein
MPRRSPDKIPDATAEVGHPELGQRLKALRVSAGHSMADVAEGTGISTSFLSLVESQRSDITLRRLLRLVEFYGVNLMDVIGADPDALAEAEIIRRGEYPHVQSPVEALDVAYLAGVGPSRRMMPMLFDLQPGGATMDRASHEGEEFVFVLAGKLCIEADDAPQLVLARGDSAYFPGGRPHSYRNIGSGPARFLAVVAPGSLHVEYDALRAPTT